jgi:low affinity Fe/Cu permease
VPAAFDFRFFKSGWTFAMALSSKNVSWFTRFARWTSHAAGTPAAFVLAVGVVLVWVVSGPFFGFSDTWQLVINTGTTIVTFLMVFAIQSSQNRDSEAIQVKLDELIRSIEGAQNHLLDLEELDESEIEKLRTGYRHLASNARERGGPSTGCPPAPT